VTGQPDFAHIVIDYVPDETIVESKALKLFLGAFRNHAGFHEDCTLTIGKRLVEAIAPKWLRIGGYWYPRGGIPIDVFWQTGKVPEGLWRHPEFLMVRGGMADVIAVANRDNRFPRVANHGKIEQPRHEALAKLKDENVVVFDQAREQRRI
jgi:7-cyano-7-deazaguanine reductase